MAGVVPLYDAVWAAGDGARDRRLRAVRREQPADGEGLSRDGRRAHQRGHARSKPGWTASSTWTIRSSDGRPSWRLGSAGPSIHLVYLEVDATDTDVAGGEPVFADGRAVGVTTSGGYGHATGRSLAFAYVDSGFEAPGSRLEIALLGDRRPATVLAAPVYDPDNERPRS